MFDSAKSIFGYIHILEREGIITISGANGKHIYEDIQRLWRTSRLSDNLFLKAGFNSFSFYSFFLPDILYLIETMITSNRIYGGRIRTLSKIRDAIKTQTWLAPKAFNSMLNYARLKDFYLTPLDYQQEFFERYDRLTQQYNLNGFLFAGAAGSGKTFSALALTYCLEPDRIIIISPKNAAHRVWEDTFKTKLKTVPSYYISASKTPSSDKEFIHVYHYEDLDKALAFAKRLKQENVAIILDESHNFNEITSLRTNLFLELCQVTQSQNVIWLSGTPIKAMSKELIPLFKCFDPLFTPPVEESFKRIYRGDAGKAASILAHRMGLVNFVVEKSRIKLTEPIMNQLKIQIPNGEQFTLEHIKTQMSQFIQERQRYYAARAKDDQTFYDQVLARYAQTIASNKTKRQAFQQYQHDVKRIQSIKGFYHFVKEEMVFCNRFEAQELLPILKPEEKALFKDVKSIIKYLPLKIRGECLGKIVGGARIACHVELAKHVDYEDLLEQTEKKTLIFTSYVDVLKSIEATCQQQHLKPVLIYGATNSKLNELIQTFEHSEQQNPLIATFDSLSTAVPLTMCDTCIMLNVPFRDYQVQQSISRIHRLGATTQTKVYMVFLDTGDKPNISTRSKEILAWSQGEIEKIMGITSPYEIKEENLSLEAYSEQWESVFEEDTEPKPAFLTW